MPRGKYGGRFGTLNLQNYYVKEKIKFSQRVLNLLKKIK